MYLNVLSPIFPSISHAFCWIIRNFSASLSCDFTAKSPCETQQALSADIPIPAALSHLSKTRQCVLIVKRSRRSSFIRHTALRSPSFTQTGDYSEPQEASYHLNFMAKLTFFFLLCVFLLFLCRRSVDTWVEDNRYFFFFFFNKRDTEG